MANTEGQTSSKRAVLAAVRVDAFKVKETGYCCKELLLIRPPLPWPFRFLYESCLQIYQPGVKIYLRTEGREVYQKN